MFKNKIIPLSLLTGLLISGCAKDKDIPKKETKELSIFLITNGVSFNENWDIYREAEKQNGIKLKAFTSKNNTNPNQAYNLMLASGELADIISFRLPPLEKLGVDGGIIPLNNLIDKHGPNIKNFINNNPRFKKDMIAQDGEIYALPTFIDYDNLKAAYGLFLRTDWLKKFNLPVPQTIEELEHALITFKENDANGNGKNDEVGIFVAGDLKTSLDFLIGIFGAKKYASFYEENGIVNFSPLSPGYKESIKLVVDWYKKGLIDQEIFTRGWGARDVLLNGNLGAMTVGWFGSTSAYNYSLNKSIPNFEFLPIEPLKVNENLKSMIYSKNTTNESSWSISSTAKNPVQAIKFMDWWFTEEGRRTWNFGIENKHYTMINGKPILSDYVLKNPDGKSPLKVLHEAGSQVAGIGVHQDAQYEYQWVSDIAKNGYKIYMKEGNMIEHMPILKYNDSELQELEKILINTKQISEEYLQKWILGATDINKEWDIYIQQLKDANIDRAIELTQKSYNNYIKN